MLILHTGGTIGLSRGKENKSEHTLQKNHFAIEIAKLPSLNIRVKKDTDPAEYNILPKVGGNILKKNTTKKNTAHQICFHFHARERRSNNLRVV